MTPKTPSRGLFVASEPPSGSPTSSMTSKKSSIRDWISRTPSLLRRFSAPSRKAAAQPTAVPSPTVNLAQQSQDMLEIAEPNNVRIVSRAKAAWVISILTGVTFVGNMSTGLVTISLPTIARDLGLAPHLLLWPASVFPLASACCLVVAGAVADFIGNRNINLIGCFLLAIFTTAAGVADNGIRFILFRSFQGVALSLCLPTTISILTNNFIAGRQRNVGFACVGLSQPLGFSFGLILGGVVVDTYLTWRFAFYFTAGLMGLLFLVSIWLLPQDTPREKFTWPRFLREIDWIGACLISAALGITSYVLAVITGNMAKAKNAENIVMLCIAGTSAVSFGFWMHFREKSGRIALIPNSLWRKRAFTTICLLVFLTYAVLNGVEYFLSLFFQEVQLLSALDAAIRFFPEVVVGILLNLFTGLFVHKINANLLITVSAALTCVAPLIMAFIDPAWNFWVAAFWAAIVCPFSVDVIFTVANLIITDAFSEGTQALAGAVFSTVAQFGHSVGLMVMAVTSNRVTAKSSIEDKESPEAIMEGYRVVFWLCFGMQLMACFVSVWGLRGVGKVGLKRE
ncbi:hypothetical protein VD0002_g2349 [Verticillium dahliae]|nr:Putative ATP-dependent helicase HRQ1 [Verticillium dahliae VDG2]PNH67339.1 hypothetical protein VD0002_g2349 [Verticillium dahliae]